MITWTATEDAAVDVTTAEISEGGAFLLRVYLDGWVTVNERETAEVIAEGRSIADVKQEVQTYAETLDVDGIVARRAAEIETYNLARAKAARTENEAPGGIYGPPTPPAPVTVAEAMATVLHLARKLDLNSAPSGQALGDLADLTEKLAHVIGARARVDSAQVVADQHFEASHTKPSDRMRSIANASAETVRTARRSYTSAAKRLAEAIVAYDPRH